MQGEGQRSLFLNSIGLACGVGETLSPCSMLLEWRGKASPIPQKGNVWKNRLSSSCHSLKHLFIHMAHLGGGQACSAGYVRALLPQLAGGQERVTLVCSLLHSKGRFSQVETSGVNGSNSVMGVISQVLGSRSKGTF